MACAGSLYVGARGAGPVPPLGPLLNPATGAWAAVTVEDLPASARATVPALGDSVVIRYDSRGVPHIFASSELDAYRAMGYAHARDRLFQIELQARAGEGTLTELVGAAALEADRETRRLGMPWAAERAWAERDTAELQTRVIEAYAAGINAYIDGLSDAAVPVEYKLLGKRPRRFEPVHTMHVRNRMGYTLTNTPEELTLLRARAQVGRPAADALLSRSSPIQEPIQPDGAGAPRDAFAPIPPPGAPDSAAARLVAALAAPAPSLLAWQRRDDPDAPRAFASNNWAVAPERSASGRALLAGDPHIELTLPAIWYEAHLVVPGQLDVGGVCIPGLPGIVIGFTRDLAWTFTNTGADVMDFWVETVDHPASPTAYELDGVMTPFGATRVETFRGTAGEVLAVDTLRVTHRGPMSRVGNAWLSMRWTVLEARRETQGLLHATRATSARAFLDTMALYYAAPAQNMLVVDRAGAIAIRSTGRYPVRADSGSGMEIRDGRTRAADWIGDWPVERYPQAFSPAQGFLASANQEPLDPRSQFAYLGVDQLYEPWRALDINRLLREAPRVTLDDMRRFQTSPLAVRAERFVPLFLDAAAAERARGASTPALDSAAAWLGRWDRRYTVDNTGAALFGEALWSLRRLAFDELDAKGAYGTFVVPTWARLFELAQQPDNPWWDRRATTGVVETRDAVLAAALVEGWSRLRERAGPPSDSGWRWGAVSPARVSHLLGLPGFSELRLPVQGGPGTLNPSTGGGFGASWRMVVEAGPELRVLGTYPGGQSGNPGSPRYADRQRRWQAGELDTLVIPRSLDELPAARARATLTLVTGGR